MNNKKRKKPCSIHVVTKIDNKAPHFNTSAYLKPYDLLRDAVRIRQIDKENMILLKNINIIHRLGVSIMSYFNLLKLIQFYIYYILKTKNLFIIIF